MSEQRRGVEAGTSEERPSLAAELGVMRAIFEALQPLTREQRVRVLRAVCILYGIPVQGV